MTANSMHEYYEKVTAFRESGKCDAGDDAGIYFFPGGEVGCRCMVCGRCGHHTGNSTQGHYWSFCKVTGHTRGHHFCCPNDCELENI